MKSLFTNLFLISFVFGVTSCSSSPDENNSPETVQELGDGSIECKLDIDFWVKECFK